MQSSVLVKSGRTRSCTFSLVLSVRYPPHPASASALQPLELPAQRLASFSCTYKFLVVSVGCCRAQSALLRTAQLGCTSIGPASTGKLLGVCRGSKGRVWDFVGTSFFVHSLNQVALQVGKLAPSQIFGRQRLVTDHCKFVSVQKYGKRLLLARGKTKVFRLLDAFRGGYVHRSCWVLHRFDLLLQVARRWKRSSKRSARSASKRASSSFEALPPAWLGGSSLAQRSRRGVMSIPPRLLTRLVLDWAGVCRVLAPVAENCSFRTCVRLRALCKFWSQRSCTCAFIVFVVSLSASSSSLLSAPLRLRRHSLLGEDPSRSWLHLPLGTHTT
eukprot:m.421163 g.421163  ORF g.421163 m.421163 type:complete len:329 (+) comp20194_c0_seq6:395-1381(+)